MNRRWLIAVLLLPCLLLCACAPKETVSPYADIPKPTAVITMENGSTMTFTLDPASAPNTVSNFISLANAGFYDGMKIDYVYPTYFLRSGDPNGPDADGTPMPHWNELTPETPYAMHFTEEHVGTDRTGPSEVIRFIVDDHMAKIGKK